MEIYHSDFGGDFVCDSDFVWCGKLRVGVLRFVYVVMRISRGYRNNNPLNIRRCAKNRWVGLAEVQGDGEFCVFRSMVYGFRAAFV